MCANCVTEQVIGEFCEAFGHFTRALRTFRMGLTLAEEDGKLHLIAAIHEDLPGINPGDPAVMSGFSLYEFPFDVEKLYWLFRKDENAG